MVSDDWRKNFVHQFIGPGKLINTDDAVMEFQRKGAASLGKSEAVGDMVIALLRLLRVAMSVKNPAGTGKASFREYKDPDLPASDIREWDNWRRD